MHRVVKKLKGGFDYTLEYFLTANKLAKTLIAAATKNWIPKI